MGSAVLDFVLIFFTPFPNLSKRAPFGGKIRKDSKSHLGFFKNQVIDFGGSNLTPEANQLGAQLLPIINQ